MAQSLVYNYMHNTFSTKDRDPFIDKNISEQLYSYLGGIYKNLECKPNIKKTFQDGLGHS